MDLKTTFEMKDKKSMTFWLTAILGVLALVGCFRRPEFLDVQIFNHIFSCILALNCWILYVNIFKRNAIKWTSL